MDDLKKNKLYGNEEEETLVRETFSFDDTSDGDIFISLDETDDDVKIYGGKKETTRIAEKSVALQEEPSDEDYLDEIDDEIADRTIGKGATEEAVDASFDEAFFNTVYNKKVSRKNMATIAFIAVLVIIMIVFTFVFVKNSTMGTNTVYDGVLVNGYNLGGKTKAQVIEYINETYFMPISEANITIKLGNDAYVYPLTDFVICPDAESVAETAYNIGRTGTDSERVAKIKQLKKKNESILVEYKLVTDKLNEIIEKAEDQGFVAVVDPTYDVRDDGVVFTSGRNGLSADVAQFKSDLNDVLKNFEEAIVNIESEATLKDATIVINLVETNFKALDKDEIQSAAFMSASGAVYQRTGTSLTSPITVA